LECEEAETSGPVQEAADTSNSIEGTEHQSEQEGGDHDWSPSPDLEAFQALFSIPSFSFL